MCTRRESEVLQLKFGAVTKQRDSGRSEHDDRLGDHLLVQHGLQYKQRREPLRDLWRRYRCIA